MRVTTTVNGQEKFIGELVDGTLHLKRQKNKHFYNKLNAYGMDSSVVKYELPEMDCHEITIHETDTDDYYTVPLDVFIRKGVPQQHGGHGAQLMLPLRYWRKH
ncbi:hypothetical protein D3C85_495640 [compost metagenome]